MLSWLGCDASQEAHSETLQGGLEDTGLWESQPHQGTSPDGRAAWPLEAAGVAGGVGTGAWPWGLSLRHARPHEVPPHPEPEEWSRRHAPRPLNHQPLGQPLLPPVVLVGPSGHRSEKADQTPGLGSLGPLQAPPGHKHPVLTATRQPSPTAPVTAVRPALHPAGAQQVHAACTGQEGSSLHS